MNEDDRILIEFSDEEGNTMVLEELDTFFYNGDEFALLGDAEDECDCGGEHDHDHGECEHEHSLYIMKMITSTDEDGDDVVEYVPVEDETLMEALIEVVQTQILVDDIEEVDGE